MAIVRQTTVYQGPGGPFEGVIAYDDEVETTRPGVMIVPNVLGQKEEDNANAEKLARLGYVGFACDVFGQGQRGSFDRPDYAKHMAALNDDRGLLRDRLQASLDA
ncbi:MAG: dienelactone hydrolase family protein, partial [Sphingomonas sp.]